MTNVTMIAINANIVGITTDTIRFLLSTLSAFLSLFSLRDSFCFFFPLELPMTVRQTNSPPPMFKVYLINNLIRVTVKAKLATEKALPKPEFQFQNAFGLTI